MKVIQSTVTLSQHEAWKMRMILEDFIKEENTSDGFVKFAESLLLDLPEDIK